MPDYAGLPSATIRFLAGLAANNTRDWFAAHRPDYERDWRDAGLDLITALVPFCEAAVPRLDAVPRLNGGLRRLNRDVRFSADKTPYVPALHIALTVTGGPQAAGMHLVIHHDRLGFGAGQHMLAPDALGAFRARVCDEAAREALMQAAAVAEAAGSHWDEPDLKRVPAGYVAAPEWDHLLRRKSVIMRGETDTLPEWLFTADALSGLQALIAAHLPLLGWIVGRS